MKDNALQVFMYNGKEVRTIEIDGETWFVAKDVCDILEIVNHRDTMQNVWTKTKKGCRQFLLRQMADTPM